MRKVTIIEHMTLDGVIQAPGGLEEDTDGGFAYGGWSFPIQDPVVGRVVEEVHAPGFDLLLGRRVYDIWANYWPHQPAGVVADSINGAVKHVATHRPDSLSWGPAEWLGADVAEGVHKAKAGEGPDLLCWGSSELVQVLLEHRLADELILIVYPVLIGTGKRLFADGTPPMELEPLGSEVGEAGVCVHRFRPGGKLRTRSMSGVR